MSCSLEVSINFVCSISVVKAEVFPDIRLERGWHISKRSFFLSKKKLLLQQSGNNKFTLIHVMSTAVRSHEVASTGSKVAGIFSVQHIFE